MARRSSPASSRLVYLSFAAAYLSQAKLDLANGRPDFAEWAMENRRKYQRKLAALRRNRAGAV